MSNPKLLLIHANPMQRVLPVPPYGLELVATSARKAGAIVEILDPFLISDDPIAATLECIKRFNPSIIGFGLRVLEDCIPIDSLEGSAHTDVYSVIPEVKQLVDAVRLAAPSIPTLVGGAAFSSFPSEVLTALDIDYGI